MDGEIRPQQLANFVSVLRNFDLRYSIPGYNRLNLAYDPRHDLCKRIAAESGSAAPPARIASSITAVCRRWTICAAACHHTPLTEEELITGATRRGGRHSSNSPLRRGQ
ncbi:MAG: hypothetical protein R2856_37685 [Caldilineaceae bacterium]